MKSLMLAIVLSCGMVACAPPVSLQTSQGKTAFTADRIVQRVNELENAAIQAQATGGLDTGTARVLVSFAVAADKTLKDTPNGWQVTIATGWAEVHRQLPMITNPTLAAVIGTVDVAITALGGVQ